MREQEAHKFKLARDLYRELLTEARENLSKLAKERQELSNQIFKAQMMEFATGENDELLLEQEQLTLKEWKSRLEDFFKREKFWQERFDKLRKYRPEKFFDTLETNLELENLVSRSFDSSNADLEE